MPPTPDEIFSWIETQARFGCRRPGSPAGLKNEVFLEAKLREFGLAEVRKEPIPITHHQATSWQLELKTSTDTTALDSFPIPYTAFTTEEGFEAPLVFADSTRLLEGSEEWRGKIVVTEIRFPVLDTKLLTRISMGYHDPDDSLSRVQHPATWVRLGWHVYQRAVKHGAAGFIGILRDQPGGTCRMYAPYGFREKNILDKPIPGFWVGRAEGAVVRAFAEKRAGMAKLQITGIRETAVTHNIVGEIPGLSDEVIVLSCHHDSPFESPVEDASGISVVLALARHFAEQKKLRRRLVVLLSAGHFYGSIGTRAFIHEHRQDLVPRTVLEISIEHIAREAVEDSSGKLVPSGHPEPTGIFAPFSRAVTEAILASVKAHDLRRTLILPPEGPLGDYPPTDGGDWYAAGVPVINAISNPVYLLTADDALHWVDRERLTATVNAFIEIIEKVDAMPRAQIAEVSAPFYRLTMRALKHLQRARTTTLGLMPVY